MSGRPDTVAEVIGRMRDIDGELSPGDGVKVFNRMYLTATEEIGRRLDSGPEFADPAFMAELDVRFACLWLEAFDAATGGGVVPKAWAPLFEQRSSRRVLPIQFALAGMNAHIEHDLPLAVVETCRARGVELGPAVHRDYEAVNEVLASVESGIRRSFLTDVERRVDDEIGPVVHLVSSWNIDKARDLAWVTAQTLWELGRLPLGLLYRRFADSLARTVGMGSRILLTPVALAAGVR